MSEFTKYFLLLIIAQAILTIGMLIVDQQYVYADPNCDKSNLGANDQGHIRGNSHCSTGVEPKEPPRDCGHKNSEKDNDGDGATICINRG